MSDNNSPNADSLIVEDSAVKRIDELRHQQSKPDLRLRITVDSGGCSGFQYILALDEISAPEDHIFDNCVICDDISLPYLKGSTISFARGLVGSEFQINNPNAVAGCGCGTSFSVKS